MQINKRHSWMCGLVLLVIALVAAWPVVVRAFNPQPEPPAFGMVGIARLQTARLNVANLQPPQERADAINPCVCPARLSFVDASGQPFVDRTGMPVMMDVSVDPGQAVFLDLRSADVFRESNALRAQFRAVVEFTQPPDPAIEADCQKAAATLEIFDNFTGRTMVLYAQPPDPAVPEQETPR